MEYECRLDLGILFFSNHLQYDRNTMHGPSQLSLLSFQIEAARLSQELHARRHTNHGIYVRPLMVEDLNLLQRYIDEVFACPRPILQAVLEILGGKLK